LALAARLRCIRASPHSLTLAPILLISLSFHVKEEPEMARFAAGVMAGALVLGSALLSVLLVAGSYMVSPVATASNQDAAQMAIAMPPTDERGRSR
jgi:hypothetical protein